MANSVDQDQTAPIGAVCSGSTLFASILNSSVMLGNYLQQTTSADDIIRCNFFLGALWVKIIFSMGTIFQSFWKNPIFSKCVTFMSLNGCFQPCSLGNVSKKAKIRNRYNQVPHRPRTPHGKVTKTPENAKFERAKRLALSQQVTTMLR